MPDCDFGDRYNLYDDLHFPRDYTSEHAIAADLTAEQALTQLRDLAMEAKHSPGAQVTRIWNRITVEDNDCRLLLSYLVLPARQNNIADLYHLLRASLRTRWPAAAFTALPRWRADAQVQWIDGPTPEAVLNFVHGWPDFDRTLGAEVTQRRYHSAHGWQQILGRAERALGLTVPRSESGDIDWDAAHRIQVPAPVRIGHLNTGDDDEYTHYGLDEILRMLPDYMDLTHAPDR
ncbi:hypothetical protein [Nocardia sp. NPDC052566]|uniref:hypothetical protein n=1 Tax=Nocardia sp. NPDC052566 TaxID=3364330 RepID=UPI0037CB078B